MTDNCVKTDKKLLPVCLTQYSGTSDNRALALISRTPVAVLGERKLRELEPLRSETLLYSTTYVEMSALYTLVH